MAEESNRTPSRGDEAGLGEFDADVSRRRFIKGSAVAGSALVAGGVLAACGSSSGGGSGGATTGGAQTPTVSNGALSPTGKQLQEILGVPKNILAKGPGKLKIAGQWPLTGAGSVYGVLQTGGFNYGVQQVAEWTQGKLQFETKAYDNQSGIPQAEAAAGRQAGLSGVPVLISSYIFGFGAILPFSAQYKMFTPDPGGGAGPIPGPFAGKPYCYGFRPGYPTDLFDGLVKYITMKHPTAKKWAMLQPVIAPPYNNAVLAYANKLWPRYGVDFVGQVLAPLGATNYASSIQKLKAMNPDVILYTSFGTDPGYQAKEAASQGLNAISATIDFTPTLAKLGGAALKGWYFGVDYLNNVNPPNQWAKFFLDNWKKDHGGQPPNYYSANDYCTAFAVAELVDRILGAGGDINSGADYVTQLNANPKFPHVYGGQGQKTGEIVIDTTTHSPSSLEMLLFTVPGSGNVADITPLATYNLRARDFKLV